MDGQYDAAVMAGAGIIRLGLDQYIADWLPFSQMLPAPGQGALGIQCRAGDERILAVLGKINDANTARAVQAERAFLLALGGGCSIPVGAYARVADDIIQMNGLVVAADGSRSFEVSGFGGSPQALGVQLAEQALAQGAGEVLYA
jgi:hydroxymethylbilane synthase